MLEKIRNIMDKVLSNTAAILFFISVMSTFIGVLDRTFGLNLKTVWVEELTRFTMIWATMMLIGIGTRKGTQTRLTLLAEHLSEKKSELLNIFIMLLVILLFSILFYFGLRSAINNRTQMSAVMQISMFWPYMAIPFSALFVLFESITNIYETAAALVKSKHLKKEGE